VVVLATAPRARATQKPVVTMLGESSFFHCGHQYAKTRYLLEVGQTTAQATQRKVVPLIMLLLWMSATSATSLSNMFYHLLSLLVTPLPLHWFRSPTIEYRSVDNMRANKLVHSEEMAAKHSGLDQMAAC
jgi:hypothetical protein